MTISVTGSSGYIGGSLAEELESHESVSKVRRIDRSPTSSIDERTIILDLARVSVGKLAEVLKGTDYLFHLAAARTDWGLSYAEYHHDNAVATKNLIDAAQQAGVTQWIYFGTVGVYGPSEEPKNEKAQFAPTTDYGQTKAEAERSLFRAARSYGWNVGVIRPSAVFSEGQPDNTNIFRLIEANRKRRFVLIGEGAQIKTTSYLQNTVDAAIWLFNRVMEAVTPEIQAFNYVDEPKLTTNQMVRIIRDELGIARPPLKVPRTMVEKPALFFDAIARVTGRDLPITSARIRKFSTATDFDASAIRKAGFAPRYSSIDALIRTTRSHLKLPTLATHDNT